MKAFLAVLAIVLVALFVVRRQPDGSGADRDAGSGSASGGARCTVFADAPVVERDGRVTGVGRYRCGSPDGGVDTIVYLQLRSGTGWWANVAREPMAAAGADTTRKRPPENRAVRVSAPCTPASYRTFVGGMVSNGDVGLLVQANSKPVSLRCTGHAPE